MLTALCTITQFATALLVSALVGRPEEQWMPARPGKSVSGVGEGKVNWKEVWMGWVYQAQAGMESVAGAGMCHVLIPILSLIHPHGSTHTSNIAGADLS